MKTPSFRLLVSIIAITAAACAFGAKRSSGTSAGTPDFAYPATVTKNAETALSAALKSGNGKATVRALADIALAQAAIGNDKVYPVITRIEQIKNNEQDAVTRSLLSMLLADIYSDIYNINKYNYDRRELPMTPLPADITEWSGKQFRAHIDTLCSEALIPAAELQKEPLSAYSDIISASKETLVYYPTLYDFAARFTIDTRTSLSPFSNMFSLIYLTPRSIFTSMPIFVPSSTMAADVLRTYAEWMKFHADDVAPLINIDMRRIALITNGLYSTQFNEGRLRQRELMIDLYNRYRTSEYSGDILIALAGLNDDYIPGFTPEFHAMLQYNIKTYPAFHRINCLKNAIAAIERQRSEIMTADIIAPGVDFEVSIKAHNTPSLTLDFYNIAPDSPADNYYRFNSKKQQLVKSVTVQMPGKIPYQTDTTLTVSLPQEGFYIAVPRDDDNKTSRSYQIIRSSRLALASAQLRDQNIFVITDPVTGAPVENAEIRTIRTRQKNTVINKLSGLSDSNGFITPAAIGSDGQHYQATKGTDSYSHPIYIYNFSRNERQDSTFAAFTDLSIYHPGDTVNWVAIMYTYGQEEQKAISGHSVEAILTTPNGEPCDTVTTSTDEFGRATGQFTLPADGLTGKAAISFRAGTAYRRTMFMVSDYKLPTFAVKVAGVDRNTPAEGAVTLRGNAKTYSGVAVASATVTLNLSVAQPMWWSRSNAVEFYSAEASTDAAGNFTIEIPAEVFSAGPAPNGIYTAQVTVTSTAGESRQTRREFTLGPTYTLQVAMPSSLEVTKPVTLNLKVTDGEGKAVNKQVNYTLSRTDATESTSGKLSSAHPVIDLSSLESGKYRAYFLIEGNDSAYAVNDIPVVIYKTTDKKSPVSQVLWTPADGTTLTIDKGRNISAIYATSAPESHVLYILSSAEKGIIIEKQWLKTKAGMHKLDIKLPEGIDKANVKLSTSYGLSTASADFNVIAADSQKSLGIVTETFRDRIIPGAEESWTLRTIDRDSSGTRAAMILDMFNSALSGIDGLTLTQWELTPLSRQAAGLQWAEHTPGTTHKYLSSTASTNRKCPSLDIPAWVLYGRGFASHIIYHKLSSQLHGVKTRGTGVSLMSAAADDFVVCKEEAAAESDAAISENAITASKATDAGGEQPQSDPTEQAEKPFTYRQSEMPLAFFAPLLTTDEHGQLTYTFTVPNANTTWQFNAIAYTADMTASSINLDVTANKPVMVQPNLPRYLRSGDDAVIKATVMNNSSTALDITTHTELFDITSGRIIASTDTCTNIAAGTSAVVCSHLEAPADAPFIGYRIKSSTDEYADGEQTYLAVLPYTTPVVETQPFYMAHDSTSLALQLPSMPADSRVTLQFCENPIWYVVTALPGLRETAPRTAPDAAATIFSAAVADGILRTYPQVADAIKRWTQSDRSDSTLVSMLERNADLKTVLLNATPWMMDARSDTERMQRLALLFDKKELESTYTKSIDILSRLLRSDGGWAWQENSSESSEWGTSAVLHTLGELNRMGFMPSDKRLNAMIAPALDMLQRATIKDWRKYPKANYYDYVMLRDLWPQYKQSAEGNRLTAAMVQRAIKQWKNMDISSKAQTALMLKRHGNNAVARLILSSLRQYAEVSPTQGMHWPSVGDGLGGSMTQLRVSADALEAFAAVEPGCTEIDAIRQWLILQKETRNWGSSAVTSSVIASILCTSDKWIAPAAGTEITLGTTEINPGDTEKTLGYFRTDISQLHPSGATLHIAKNGNTPAWGAVYCQYTDLMTEVKPSSCEALSIDKRLFKKVGSEWIETDSIAVGDRVKVMLTIHAARDLQYVAITDDRAACLEPVEQMPAPLYSEGVCFYRENRDSRTNMFVTNMPKGTYILGYELWVNNAGTFVSGIATAQSQYAPQITAHSGGCAITVSE